MRFYKNKQAEMLNRVSFMLNKEQDKLVKKVPALKKFIAEFIEKEKELYAIVIRNPYAVKTNTWQKVSAKEAFIKAVAKLIAVLKASNYKFKGKPLDEMRYTHSDLIGLSAEKLCQAYLKVFGAVKKIRNLQYYGLSDEDMRDMQAYYGEFAAIKNAPALKKKVVASQNARLNKGVKEGITFLKNHIDSLMLIAAEDDIELTMKYKAIRTVLPRSQGRPSDTEVAYRKSRTPKKRES